MKRIFALMIALCLCAAVVPALAEADEVQPLAEGASLTVDLDGDGADETVAWTMAPGKYGDACLALNVAAANGESLQYVTDIIWNGGVYVHDMDADSLPEILMTGDVMSDDYYTWCLQYRGGKLIEVLFPDCERGDNSDGYFKQGYGLITRITDHVVQLTGSQDVLGTWMASRVVSLDFPGRFEFCDNGLWERPGDYEGDDSLWEYGALIVRAPLKYVGEHGSEDGVLNPGDKVLVYATDKRSEAHFLTPDGRSGILEISTDYDRGWGLLVDGIPEAEGFEMIPYAD